jgi:hypothetical protein
MDLLTTYTSNSELQVIIAPSLISAATANIFQHDVSSSAASWQRLLTVEIIQLPRSSPHELTCLIQSQSQSHIATDD